MARMISPLRALMTLGLAAVALNAAVASGAHVCLQHGSTFYDITTDASGTTMKRWNTGVSPAALIDTQGYAALTQPGNPADMWGDGVAFAATMQTRSAWLNMEPNPTAYWDAASGGSDTWRFQTSIGGVATEWAFRTSQCNPPPPNPTRVCLQHGGVYYDITTDTNAATTMDRWHMATNPPTFMDRNGFAALHRPASASDMWGEGVAFAAAMQTRSAWVNQPEPNPTAFWDAPSGGSETWRFQTTIGEVATEWTFRTNQCLGLVAPPLAPTSAPTSLAPPPAGGSHHVCFTWAATSTHFDIVADASGTTMKRYNTAVSPAALIDTNTFAALQQPASATDVWGAGVEFAAAMQTRSAWVNGQPNPVAYWELATPTADAWRFFSWTADGATSLEFVFHTNQCWSA